MGRTDRTSIVIIGGAVVVVAATLLLVSTRGSREPDRGRAPDPQVAADMPLADGADPARERPSRGDRALAALERALARAAAAVGREHPDYVIAEYQLAVAEIARGHCDRAQPRLAHAADVLWRTDDPLQLAFVQLGLGECELRAGRGRQAGAEFQRLLSLCREVDCPSILPPLGRFGLGQGAWLDGDRERAAGLLAAARAEVAALGAGAAPQLDQLDAWLREEKVQLPR